jgi:tetratricopeptide (TPR) repeat protein
MRKRRLLSTAAAACLALATATIQAEGPAPAVKPEGRPVTPKGEDKPPAPKQETPEEAAHRAYSARIDARDKADLMRSAYEKANRPGPPPDAALKQFEDIVAAYRAAIDLEPRSPESTYCRYRLAGAYMYVGQRESAMRVMQEAVNVAATPTQQLEACHEIGLHQLQALHKPDEALRWFRRAETLLDKVEEPQLRAKWTLAIAQGIERCEPPPPPAPKNKK